MDGSPGQRHCSVSLPFSFPPLEADRPATLTAQILTRRILPEMGKSPVQGLTAFVTVTSLSRLKRVISKRKKGEKKEYQSNSDRLG